jgi:hypothetical protein
VHVNEGAFNNLYFMKFHGMKEVRVLPYSCNVTARVRQ